MRRFRDIAIRGEPDATRRTSTRSTGRTTACRVMRSVVSGKCARGAGPVSCVRGWAESWPDPVQICNGGPGVTGSGAAGSGGVGVGAVGSGVTGPGPGNGCPGSGLTGPGSGVGGGSRGTGGRPGSTGVGSTGCGAPGSGAPGCGNPPGAVGSGIVMTSSRVMGRHRPEFLHRPRAVPKYPGSARPNHRQPGGNDSQALARQRPRLSGPASGNSQVETWWWANRSGFRFRTTRSRT